MNTEGKNKTVGAAGTLLLHIVVIVFLLVTTLDAAPPTEDKGIPTEIVVELEPELTEMIDLPSGESGAQKAQGGSDTNAPEKAPETDAPTPTPPAEKLIAQAEEKSITVPEPPKKVNNKKTEPKETEEQRKARLLREEEARKAAEKRAAEEADRKRQAENNTLVSNAFAKGDQQQTTGDGKESPKGISDGVKITGKGSVGKQGDFGGRTPITGTYVDPIHDVNESGTVTITFTIYENGNINTADMSVTGTQNIKMRERALEAAKKIKFKPSDKPTGPARGKITYNFGIK